jgi:hypothetical protein
MTSEITVETESKQGILYYKCVNCGHCGKYSFRRSVTHNCESCGYDEPLGYELEEILEDDHLKFLFQGVINIET